MERKIGLVFDGGGAKGAYQIGVWKAMRETGLDEQVTEVSGTSVGGLNAALFINGDLKAAEEIWKKDITEIKNWFKLQKNVSDFIDRVLGDMSCFDKSRLNCYISSYNKKSRNTAEKYEPAEDGNIKRFYNGKFEYSNMRYLSVEERKTVLLATSAIPFFCPPVKFKGGLHDDAGTHSPDALSPVYPLYVTKSSNRVVAIHLEPTTHIDESKYPGVSVNEINPSTDTGFLLGYVDFTEENSQMLISRGYADTIALFERLKERQ